MLKCFNNVAHAFTLLAVAALPAFAESVDITVMQETIPASCTPYVSNGGVVDYGNIVASSLNANALTLLEAKSLNFSLACDNLAKVALSVVTQRPLSAVNSVGGLDDIASSGLALFSDSSTDSVGLGLSGEKGIGGYGIRINPSNSALSDGETGINSVLIESDDNGSNWSLSSGSLVKQSTVRLISWAESGTPNTPVAFQTFSGSIDVQAYINKTSELNLSNAITLDGLATIELTYL